jgi:hypothetical protein
MVVRLENVPHSGDGYCATEAEVSALELQG